MDIGARLRVPSGVERWALGAGGLVWLGAGAALAAGWVGAALVAGLSVAALARKRTGGVLVLSASLVGGTISGGLAARGDQLVMSAPALEGAVRMAGWALDDVRPGHTGDWFLLQPSHLQRDGEWVPWSGAPVLVGLTEDIEVAARQRVQVDGTARSVPGRARGSPYAGRVTARRVVVLGGAADPLFRVGNAVRGRVADGLLAYGDSPAAALVSGFLIGDVRALPPLDGERLRRAGLSHFVAVSGSNVAVFLALWWIVTGPLALGPRRRAAAGLIGLVLFVVITRWEPSVVRASTMAGLVLVGRTAGISLSPWSALGIAVGGVLLVAGELAGNVGFQLSVAATAGVIAGAHLFGSRRYPRIASSLSVTVSAQIAVAPLLLVHFGSVPLVSPLANLVAAPLVMAATVAGGLGVLLGIGPLTGLAVAAAHLVLDIARWAAPWPQLGITGLAVAAVLLAASLWRPLRPAIAVTMAGWLAFVVFAPVLESREAAVVVMDVGQGDAILLRGADGETVLIDGGPDPVVLVRKLRRFGVERIDVAVLTHPHADHATGMVAALGSFPVGRLWHPGILEGGSVFGEIVEMAVQKGIVVEVPEAGWSVTLGSIRLEIIGPLRRYASPNDQSLVVLAAVLDRTVLLPGDIEVIAQRELGPVPADILKVPHQGAATSDLDWLQKVGAGTAVISVGPNTFGHPSAEVIAALEAAGADVRRTDEEGDVVIPLGS